MEAMKEGEAMERFKEGIRLVINFWWEIRCFVANGGCSNPRPILEQLYDHLFSWFIQSKDPPPPVSSAKSKLKRLIWAFLGHTTLTSLDNSLEEVAKQLVVMYQECLQGDFSSLEIITEANLSNARRRMSKLKPISHRSTVQLGDRMRVFREGIVLFMEILWERRVFVHESCGPKPQLMLQELADDILFWFTQTIKPRSFDFMEWIIRNEMYSLPVDVDAATTGITKEVATKLMLMHDECLEGDFSSVQILRDESQSKTGIAVASTEVGKISGGTPLKRTRRELPQSTAETEKRKKVSPRHAALPPAMKQGMDPMDVTVTMHLSSHEDTAYRLQFCDTMRLVRRFNPIDGIKLSTNNMNLFLDSFEKLRLTCTRPAYVDPSDLSTFDDENHIKELFTRIVEANRCSVCGAAGVDSILCCHHLLCYDCAYKIAENTRKCPFCRTPLHDPFNNIKCLSEKLKLVVEDAVAFQVQIPSAKILILSSCIRSLKSVKGALSGYALPPMICDELMNSQDVIDNFLKSTTSVLLLPFTALTRDIVLPCHSSLLIVESVVPDVKSYIYERVRTEGAENTLHRRMYIASNTVEQCISSESNYVDLHDFFDDDSDFVGPMCMRKVRTLVLLKQARGFIQDPREEAEEMEFDDYELDVWK